MAVYVEPFSPVIIAPSLYQTYEVPPDAVNVTGLPSKHITPLTGESNISPGQGS